MKTLIEQNKESELSMFCETALKDIEGKDIEEIKEYFRNETL